MTESQREKIWVGPRFPDDPAPKRGDVVWLLGRGEEGTVLEGELIGSQHCEAGPPLVPYRILSPGAYPGDDLAGHAWPAYCEPVERERA